MEELLLVRHFAKCFTFIISLNFHKNPMRHYSSFSEEEKENYSSEMSLGRDSRADLPTPNISALNLDSTPATFGYLIAFNFFNVIHIFIYFSP